MKLKLYTKADNNLCLNTAGWKLGGGGYMRVEDWITYYGGKMKFWE